MSGNCTIETRVWVVISIKLHLQQKDNKTAWNRERERERGHPNTYHYADASGRLLRLFVTDSAQTDTLTKKSQVKSWHVSTHCHATLYTTRPRFGRPNVPPLFELYRWLFSRQRRRSRCSKFFITVSSKLQTPAERTPDLAAR